MTGSLLEALEKYLQQEYTSFHMPGHKGRGRLNKLSHLLEKYGLKMDLTELPGLDNLHCPVGPILAGELEAASLMGSKQAFFLVNGATAGILAGVLACARPGDKVLLPRNVHRACWSALVLGDLHPVYVLPRIYEPLQVFLPASLSSYRDAFARCSDGDDSGEGQALKMLVALNPTYEGLVGKDLEQIISWARRQGLVTLIDEAHGSLFPLHRDLPLSAVQAGADLVVHGTHKTLGSLTQTGLLHLGSGQIPETMIRKALQLVQTTSPSYLLMASLVEITEIQQEREPVDRLVALALTARQEIAGMKGFSLVDREVIGHYPDLCADLTRIVVSPLELGLAGHELASCLGKEYGIQVEMASWGYVVLLLGLGTVAADVTRLVGALTQLSLRYAGVSVSGKFRQRNALLSDLWRAALANKPTLEPLVSPRESFYGDTKEVLLAKAVGEVAGELVCPYPPGIPILFPGELVTKEIVELLQLITDNRTIKILS